MRLINKLLLLLLLLLPSPTIAQNAGTIILNVPASTQPSAVTITVSVPGSVASGATQPATQPAAKMRIGTNVSGNDPWQTDAAWCDFTHRMTGWYKGDQDAPVVYGVGGYPLTPAFSHGWLYGYIGGKFHIHWQGGSNLSVVGKTVSNIVTEGAGQGGDVTFASGELCKFRATGPVSDVHLYAPDAPAGQTFRPAYLAGLKQFAVVRLMPWARVNKDSASRVWPLQWSQRVLPTDYDQTTREVALEYQLELAKESGCIPWIVTYYGEDDDALTRTAQLVATYGFTTVVVEAGNEWWNEGGPYQGNLIRQDALNAGIYGATDPNVAGARRAASIGANVGKIFRGVLGAKLKMVYGAQATWGAWASDGLSFVPRGSFDVLAIAPYFNPAGTLTANPPPADIEASCATWIKTILANGLAENSAAANKAGVALWCYEGGQSCFPLMANAPSVPLQDTAVNLAAFNADAMTKFQSDPGMGRLYDQLFDLCRTYNVTEFTHFLYVGYWGKSGYWGAKQMPTDPDNAKNQALSRAIAASN